jgi:hypothetical protein
MAIMQRRSARSVLEYLNAGIGFCHGLSECLRGFSDIEARISIMRGENLRKPVGTGF